jgi:serine/threonine-protein kinase ATR
LHASLGLCPEETFIDGVIRILNLQVLREHRETLISVMETFVHDPLCEWTKRQVRMSEEMDNPQAKDALATLEGEGTPGVD